MRISIGIAFMMMMAVLIPMAGAADIENFYVDLPTRSILTVGADGMYDTIQDAVDNASSGDTVHIYSGIYNESVYVNKSLTLMGNGSTETILNGSESGDGFTIYLNGTGIAGDRFSVNGMNIENGKSNSSFGLIAVDVEYLDIIDDKFVGFGSDLKDSVNSAVHISKSAGVTVENCYFDIGSNAGGISIVDSNQIVVNKCSIYSNRGGIILSGSDNSHIRDNTIFSGNGITLIDGCMNNTIEENYMRAMTGLNYDWSKYSGWGIGLFNDCDENQIHDNEVRMALKGISINNGSDDNILLFNKIWHNDFGVVFNDHHSVNKQYAVCSNNLVENNTIIYNDYGIVANKTDELEVDWCEIMHGKYGMTGEDSTNFYLHNSTIRNWTIGFLMSDSSWGSVKWNLFHRCSDVAMTVYWDVKPVEHMRIYGNAFVLNGGSGATYDPDHKQAYAGEGVDCQFDDGSSIGNYWSDWTTPDNNSDGVVDKPYHTGWKYDEDVVDNYPIVDFPFGIMMEPVITTKSLPPAYKGKGYSHYIEVVDPDTDREDLQWSFESNASWSWAIIVSDGGYLSISPGWSVAGSYWVLITVTDGIWTDEVNLTLQVLDSNKPPVITTTNVLSATEDKLYSVDYDAVDDDPITWGIVTDAGWLEMNSTTGYLHGMPQQKDVGTHKVKVVVTDGYLTNSTEFNLTVKNVNDAPEIGGDASTEIVYDPALKKYVRKKIDLYTVEDSFMSYHFNAYDEDGDKLTWTISTGPSFLSMKSVHDPVSKESDMYLNGTPRNSDVSKHVVTINVSDGNGGMAETVFNLTVNNTNDPPSITTSDVTSATENVSYSVDYDAKDVDPTNDTMSWSLLTNATFLSISKSTGILSGTPGQTDSGSYWVNVSVSDGKGGSDFSNFTLHVGAVNLPPSMKSKMADITIDEDSDDTKIDLKEIFIDPDGDDISFTSESFEGVTIYIDENWIAYIIPDPDWAGQGIITIHANDGKETSSASFAISVRNVNDAPRSAHITLSSPSFVEGGEQTIHGTSFDPDLIYGDVLNYSWYIDGELVGYGEILNLDLSAGEYALLLRVTDLRGEMIEETINIVVEKGPAIPPEPDGDLIEYIAAVIILVVAVVIILGLIAYRRRERSKDDRMTDPGMGGSPPPSYMPDPHGMGPGTEIPVPITVGEIPSMEGGMMTSGRLDDDDISVMDHPGHDMIDEIYLLASSLESSGDEDMETADILGELEGRMRNGEISRDLYDELYDTLSEE
ncbi:MAG: pectinesterase family protein [Thermoplasmatota archaeon]